ncbi:hypothetical protein [Actinophytocola sp. NPDC049390]|uniref:hypothetical protein n=1 Tax=Actinophytocola sp. NPDC049390 TaxID=3363894 RepID=UPI0037A75927
MHGEPVPGLLQHLDHVELGDALLDPAGEQLGGDLGFAAGAVVGEGERLVGGQQPHPGALEPVLDIGADVGAAGDAVDGLADDVVEAPVRALGLGEQVLDTAVTRDRDVELLVRGALAAGGEVLAAGFDVVEVRHDERVLGQHELGRAVLARQRQRGVLLVVGRGTARPREAQQPRPRLGGSGVVVSAVRAAGAAYWAVVRPLADEFWASHAVTSLSTRACWWARASPSGPSSSVMSKTTSGASVSARWPVLALRRRLAEDDCGLLASVLPGGRRRRVLCASVTAHHHPCHQSSPTGR